MKQPVHISEVIRKIQLMDGIELLSKEVLKKNTEYCITKPIGDFKFKIIKDVNGKIHLINDSLKTRTVLERFDNNDLFLILRHLETKIMVNNLNIN